MEFRRFTFLLILIISSASIFSQDIFTEYYDINHRKLRKPDKADYYLQIKEENNMWFVEKFSADNVKIYEGSYSDKKLNEKTGTFTYYFESGKTRLVEIYSQNELDGKAIRYYENGQKEYEIEYKNGSMNGICLWYHENGQMSSKEEYLGGLRTGAQFRDENGEELDEKDAEYPPKFQGEEASEFILWVNTRVGYPQEAREFGYEGEEIISFIVDAKGNVKINKIVNSVHSSIDKVVIDIILSSPKWTPGKKHGKFYEYEFEIRTNFKLN